MYCNKCGSPVPDGSRFCNNCGYSFAALYSQANQNMNSTQPVGKQNKQNNQNKQNKKKKSGSKGSNIAIVIVVILFVAFFLFLIIPDNKSETDQSTPVTDTTGAVSESQTDAAEGISINEITMVDDFECKIKEVDWYSESDFEYPTIQRESGYEYIVVVLSERNTTDETQNAPFSFIFSADGKACANLTELSLYKGQYKINFGATMANTTAEAYTIYKIPEGSQSFKMQILSNGFGTNSEYIVFGRDDIK